MLWQNRRFRPDKIQSTYWKTFHNTSSSELRFVPKFACTTMMLLLTCRYLSRLADIVNFNFCVQWTKKYVLFYVDLIISSTIIVLSITTAIFEQNEKNHALTICTHSKKIKRIYFFYLNRINDYTLQYICWYPDLPKINQAL